MILLSGYRRQDYNNSQLFIRQLEQIFAEYPESVIKAVTSPLTGIQRHVNYPPVIAEIVKALEAEMRIFRHTASIEKGKRIGREENVDRSNRPTMDEMREKYPDLLGKKITEKTQAGFRSLAEIAMECGVSQEQLDAIPAKRGQS